MRFCPKCGERYSKSKPADTGIKLTCPSCARSFCADELRDEFDERLPEYVTRARFPSVDDPRAEKIMKVLFCVIACLLGAIIGSLLFTHLF